LAPIGSNYPTELQEAIGRLHGPERFETMASFNASVAESAALVVNSARDYGDMPLIVLTATRHGSAATGNSTGSVGARSGGNRNDQSRPRRARRPVYARHQRSGSRGHTCDPSGEAAGSD